MYISTCRNIGSVWYRRRVVSLSCTFQRAVLTALCGTHGGSYRFHCTVLEALWWRSLLMFVSFIKSCLFTDLCYSIRYLLTRAVETLWHIGSNKQRSTATGMRRIAWAKGFPILALPQLAQWQGRMESSWISEIKLGCNIVLTENHPYFNLNFFHRYIPQAFVIYLYYFLIRYNSPYKPYYYCIVLAFLCAFLIR